MIVIRNKMHSEGNFTLLSLSLSDQWVNDVMLIVLTNLFINVLKCNSHMQWLEYNSSMMSMFYIF